MAANPDIASLIRATEARMKNEKALRKGRLFREATPRRLRRNQDCGIASGQKPARVEALKAHCETMRECRANTRSHAAKTRHVAAN
jgi:ribosomal protein L19E